MSNEEDIDHLTNIAYGSLMKTVTPEHIENKFLENGYIKRVVGGLVITETGHKALIDWQKKNG